MDKHEIEKGVPIPPQYPGRPRLFPWEEMAVGDSFLWPEWSRSQELHTIHSQLTTVNRRYGDRIFRARRDAEGNIRVWRVE